MLALHNNNCDKSFCAATPLSLAVDYYLLFVTPKRYT